MELIKDKNPYCPQCGRHGQTEGVSLRVEQYTAKDGRTIKNHYITCENCQQRWYIVNFGVWVIEEIKMPRKIKRREIK